MGRTQDRTWRIHPDPETGTVDPGGVVGAYQEAAIIMLRLGGAVVVVPERFKDERTGEWHTRAVNFQWSSFVPPVEAPANGHIEHDELPGIDEEALASLEGEEPFEAEEPETQPEAAEEPAVVLE